MCEGEMGEADCWLICGEGRGEIDVQGVSGVYGGAAEPALEGLECPYVCNIEAGDVAQGDVEPWRTDAELGESAFDSVVMMRGTCRDAGGAP